MKVYAIYEGGVWDQAEIRGDLFYRLEEAIAIASARVEVLQKEYDYICAQGDYPEGRRWKEANEKRTFVIKSWDNGINEIYIVQYEIR